MLILIMKNGFIEKDSKPIKNIGAIYDYHHLPVRNENSFFLDINMDRRNVNTVVIVHEKRKNTFICTISGWIIVNNKHVTSFMTIKWNP